MLRESHAQSLLAMTTVVARAMKTPARHTGCGKEEQPVRRSPMRNAALRRARFVVPRRRPRRPRHRPRQRSCHVLCSIPGALAPSMRHLHRAKRWRRLVAGSPRQVGVPRCRASLDFFESFTGSPQALSAAPTAPQGRPAFGHMPRRQAALNPAQNPYIAARGIDALDTPSNSYKTVQLG